MLKKQNNQKIEFVSQFVGLNRSKINDKQKNRIGTSAMPRSYPLIGWLSRT